MEVGTGILIPTARGTAIAESPGAAALEAHKRMVQHGPMKGGMSCPARSSWWNSFVYAIDQSASVNLCLDCRPNHAPDGQYTHFSFVSKDQPLWDQFMDEACESGGKIITFEGKTVIVTPESSSEEVAQPFGEMLTDVLKTARAAGLFAELPRGRRCILGVEELEGNFAWGLYKQQGEDNLV